MNPDQAWLLTFEWRTGSNWKRENARFIGCVGVWFADYVRRNRDCGGDDVRFIGAVPISREGFDALDGHDHGANGYDRALLPPEDEDE